MEKHAIMLFDSVRLCPSVCDCAPHVSDGGGHTMRPMTHASSLLLSMAFCPHPPPSQNVLAKMVIDRVPCVEMVRFCSSGTEACLSVLRLMRAYTKREKIIKFVGCYHGHADSFLVKAGVCPFQPSAPASTTASTTVADTAAAPALHWQQ